MTRKSSRCSRRRKFRRRQEDEDQVHQFTSYRRLSSRDLTITQQIESCKSEHEACSTTTTTKQEACQSYGCNEYHDQLPSRQMTTMSVINNLAAAQIAPDSDSINNHLRIPLIAGLTTGCAVLALIIATIAGIVFYRRRKLRKILEQQARDEKEAYIPERPPIIISKIEHVLPPPASAMTVTRTQIPASFEPAPPVVPATHYFSDYCHQTTHYDDYDYNHPHSPFVIGAQSLQIPHLDSPDPSDAATTSAFFLRRSLDLQPIKSIETSSYLSRASSVKVSQKYDHYYPPGNNLSATSIHSSNNPHTLIYNNQAMMQSSFSLTRMTTKNTTGSVYAHSLYSCSNSGTQIPNHHTTKVATQSLTEQREVVEEEESVEMRRVVSVRKNNSTNSHASSITRVGSIISHLSSSSTSKKLASSIKPAVVQPPRSTITSATKQQDTIMSRKRSIRAVLNPSPQSPFHVTLHDPPASATATALGDEVSLNYEDDTNRSGINFYFCPPPSLITDDLEDMDNKDGVILEQEEEDAFDRQRMDDFSQFSLHSSSSSLTLADGEITVYWEHPTTTTTTTTIES